VLQSSPKNAASSVRPSLACLVNRSGYCFQFQKKNEKETSVRSCF